MPLNLAGWEARFDGYLAEAKRRGQPVRYDKAEKTRLHEVKKEYLLNKLISNGISREARNIFGASPDETGKAVFEQWEREGFFGYLASGSGFMTEEGVSRLGRLVDQVYISAKEGRPVRYDELTALGFDKTLMTQWALDRQKTMVLGDGSKTVDRFLKIQAAQLTAHNKPTQPADAVKEDAIKSFPSLVDHFIVEVGEGRDAASLKSGAERLFRLFEIHYSDIRKNYGDLFANIRVDLRNIIRGLERFERITRGELTLRSNEYVLEISGQPILFARVGSEPYPTCQRLTNLYAKTTNGNGQPISRMLHGRFKAAVLRQGNSIVARTMLEITSDQSGKPALLVEWFYEEAGFGEEESFRKALKDYAEHDLGIPAERVFFSEQAEMAPKPLPVEDEVYRDTFR